MRVFAFSLVSLIFLALPGRAEELELYIDADFSVSYRAAEAIELGVRTALAEVEYQLGGVTVSLVRKDHRGNVKRSKRTMQQYLESNTALALIGGLHSPPYLQNREFMNKNRILALLPWSAGGSITRAAAGDENWIFRLSVDDTKSGEFFIREAVDRNGCATVALVLLDTGWGRGANKTLTAALAARNMKPVTTQFFAFSVGDAAAGTLASQIAASGADCAVLLANAGNGAVVVSALNKRAPDLRIFSHWGITGGSSFVDAVPHSARQEHQMLVLQTCGLRVEQAGSEVLSAALARAMPEAESLADMGAITGFVHGYDLAQILIAAAKQAAGSEGWQGPIGARRGALKAALENLKMPVTGILKTYEKPFRAYKPEDPDAHEALGLDDLCMARFREDGLLQDAG